MCCDWLDIIVGIAGGFGLGCVCTAIVAKAFFVEQMRTQRPPLPRTYLKEPPCP